MSTGTVVIRWTRYGHDRLYVTESDVRLGFWDNKSHTLHPQTPEAELALREALAAYWAAGGSRAPTASSPSAPILHARSSVNPEHPRKD